MRAVKSWVSINCVGQQGKSGTTKSIMAKKVADPCSKESEVCKCYYNHIKMFNKELITLFNF